LAFKKKQGSMMGVSLWVRRTSELSVQEFGLRIEALLRFKTGQTVADFQPVAKLTEGRSESGI